MKKITHVSFSETLLVPRRESFEKENSNVYYAGKIEGSDEFGNSTEIQLFFINCEKVKEIQAILRNEIEQAETLLKKSQSEENTQKLGEVINCFSTIEEQMNNSALVKSVPEQLLEFLHLSKIIATPNHEVIFMSGVSNIVEQ